MSCEPRCTSDLRTVYVRNTTLLHTRLNYSTPFQRFSSTDGGQVTENNCCAVFTMDFKATYRHS